MWTVMASPVLVQIDSNPFLTAFGSLVNTAQGKPNFAITSNPMLQTVELSGSASAQFSVGYVKVRSNPALISLKGLNGVAVFDSLRIAGNPLLATIELLAAGNAQCSNMENDNVCIEFADDQCLYPNSLNALATVPGTMQFVNSGVESLFAAPGWGQMRSGVGSVFSLIVSGNSKLKWITASPGPYVTQNLQIVNNPLLHSVSSFMGTTSLYVLQLSNNAVLRTIDGFGQLTSVRDSFEISNNPLLETIAGPYGGPFSALQSCGVTPGAPCTLQTNALLQYLHAPVMSVISGQLLLNDMPALRNITGFPLAATNPLTFTLSNLPAVTLIDAFNYVNSTNEWAITGMPNLVTFNAFRQMQTVTGVFQWSGNGAALLRMPALVSITKQLVVTGNDGLVLLGMSHALRTGTCTYALTL